VPAAERTLRLLEVLAAASDGLTAAELVERLRVSRSSLFALLNTLRTHGYVAQEEQRGRYQVGPALWALLPGRQHGLGPLIETFQTDIELGVMSETVALAGLDGADTVIIAQRESQQTVRAVFRPGERRPAHVTAAGLILLAGLPSGSAETFLRHHTNDLTPILNRIRKTAWTESRQGDTLELAAPICIDGVQPNAALLLSLPAFRVPDAPVTALITPLRQAAARLSYRLGAPVYQPYGWACGEPLGPKTPLQEDDVEQFLQGPWSARLACVRRDSAPHVVPLWYEWAGGCLWVAASPDAYWKTYIAGGKQVSLTVDEPWPPLRRALIAGHAEPVGNEAVPGGLAGLRQRLAARYLGQGAESRAEFQQTVGWQAVRIVPHKITGLQGLGIELGGDHVEAN
jgi:DNA-binding IclR family transcriptional regulator